MTMEEKAATWIIMARRMNAMDAAGSLHIVVSDGNMEDHHIESCMEDAKPSERAFCRDLLKFDEDERVAIFALTSGAV